MSENTMNPQHEKLLNKIRELYIQCGGRMLYTPEEHNLNNLIPIEASLTSGIEVSFDYGTPNMMCTPEGGYVILGSNNILSTGKDDFWKVFNETFDVQILIPKRNERETYKRSYDEFQNTLSGPYVLIKEKSSL